MLTVACTLRSGGDFDAAYVERLERMVRDNLSAVPYRFICLSDVPVGSIQRPLAYGFPGWWSKMETFLAQPPVLMLDLDTLIVGPIDDLARAIVREKKDVIMLRSFRRPEFGSGVMGWNHDLSWLTRRFVRYAERSEFIERSDALRMVTRYRGTFRGDQDFIQAELRREGYDIKWAQRVQAGIFSFKNHIMTNGCRLPKRATIICFHGRPRPHEIAEKLSWMRRVWLNDVA